MSIRILLALINDSVSINNRKKLKYLTKFQQTSNKSDKLFYVLLGNRSSFTFIGYLIVRLRISICLKIAKNERKLNKSHFSP